MNHGNKSARAALNTAEMIAHRVGFADGGKPVEMPKIAARPAPVMPNAGVDYGSLRLAGPSNTDIPIHASAQLDPSILAPKVTPVTTADKTMDPAWYNAQQAQKTASNIPIQLPFKRGGKVTVTPELRTLITECVREVLDNYIKSGKLGKA